MTKQEMVLSWLKDAYAMEQGIVEVLERHADEAAGYPQVRAKIREHLRQTKEHARLVARAIKRYGDDTSKVKTWSAKAFGAVQGMMGRAAHDRLIKNSLAEYSTEHFEIASYRALIAAAEELGDTETQASCQQILEQEEAMAEWLSAQLPDLTLTFLEKEHEGVR